MTTRNEVGAGNIFRSVCQEFCPRGGGGGHVWQGGCVWQGASMAVGGGACVADTTRYGQ